MIADLCGLPAHPLPTAHFGLSAKRITRSSSPNPRCNSPRPDDHPQPRVAQRCTLQRLQAAARRAVRTAARWASAAALLPGRARRNARCCAAAARRRRRARSRNAALRRGAGRVLSAARVVPSLPAAVPGSLAPQIACDLLLPSLAFRPPGGGASRACAQRVAATGRATSATRRQRARQREAAAAAAAAPRPRVRTLRSRGASALQLRGRRRPCGAGRAVQL